MNKMEKFEMSEVYRKLTKIQSEYNASDLKRKEEITDILFNKSGGYIRIRFKTFSYLVFIFKNMYHIAWFRRDDKDKTKFIQDGVRMFAEVKDLMDCLETFIWSYFNPVRGDWWQYGNRPKAVYNKTGKWD